MKWLAAAAKAVDHHTAEDTDIDQLVKRVGRPVVLPWRKLDLGEGEAALKPAGVTPR